MKQNLLFNQASALGKRLAVVLTMLLIVGIGQVWGAEEVVYTLTPAKGSNSSYTGTCDIEIDGVTWNLAGNSQMIPWRIGGKSITKTNRALYSKTAIQEDISKIVISHGAASSITVNSVTLIVSTSSNGAGTTISTLSSSFSANSTMTFTRPAGKSWAKAYYKIVYNVTVSGSSNKFIEFNEAKFYAETVPAVSYNVTWKVNGENYTTGSPSTSVSEGSQVTKLPTNPTLDCSGKTFVGWSNEEVTDGTEPDVLFATAENSPAITEPTTFHAVFATKGSNQTATFDAATISGLTKSSSSLTWTHNNSGIALYLSEGQRYTSGTPNTFTVTKGTSNYCQLSAPTGIVMSKVVATLSDANYKINSVSTPWTLSISSTIQTISSTNGSDYLKMSATSNYQIRITQLVVTYATYSDYTTSCTTQTVICAYHNIR